MKNEKGIIHLLIGVIIAISALAAVVTAGFTYVAYQDIKSQLKCGSFNCSSQVDTPVVNASKTGNGGVLVNGIQTGD